MIACAMKHHGMINPQLSRVRILSLARQALDVPIICMACDNAPCIKVCPMNARVRETNGTVVTDTQACIGCRACVYICPVGSPRANPYTGQTMTCDMCNGDETGPWCVTACKSERALTLQASGDAVTNNRARERAETSKSIFPSSVL